MVELLATVTALRPDIVGVTESWGDADISDSEFSIPGFVMFRSDRDSGHHGGGVLLFVRNELNPVETKLDSRFADQVWCKLKLTNGVDLLVGVCYRSPNLSLYGRDNDRLLNDMIFELHRRPLLLMGDFNFPDIDWSVPAGASSASQQFVDIIEDSFLTQHVKSATRGSSVLDLVFTSEPDMADNVSVLGPLGSSDHSMLHWTVRLNTVESKSNTVSLDYNRADFPSMRQELSLVDWSNVLKGNVNEQWTSFASVLNNVISRFVPVRKNCSSNADKKAPWMTYKAVKLVNKKHKLYKKYKCPRHPAYAKVAREAQIEMRRAKRSFEKKLAMNIDSDRKSFYAYVRNRSRVKPSVGPLSNDSDDTLVQGQDMAELFNEYFVSVFTVEDTAHVPTAEPLFHGDESDRLRDIHIDEDVVMKKLQQLRTDKAPGADSIAPRVLVELKDEIVLPVTEIMKCSLASGIVPDSWKTANVTPVHKAGNKQQASNYRPISLTGQICKVFESIVRDAIVDHLELYGLINGTQHGFRKGGSCLSNLLQFLDHVTQCLDDGECADALYLDFAKAFDKVPHMRLMEKLEKHGISGKVWKWVHEWLRDRTQRVCVNGHYSSWRLVTSGVPQGSVLGPILFLIFINDLEFGLVNSVFKFADDTKLLGKVNNAEDRDLLQHDLQRLVDWSDKWQMPFNSSKCKVMHFGRNNQRFQYYMSGQLLTATEEERDLGVRLTANLKPSRQCQQAYSTASKVLSMIGRTVSLKSSDVLCRLYKSLVRPHLEFCSPAWSPYYCKDKQLLERVQHRFTRMIPGFKQLSYGNRLQRLGLWSLEERRNRADLLEVFRIFRGWSVVSFDSLFSLNISVTRGHSAKIVRKRCRLDVRRHFFSERVVERWNNLDQHVIDSDTLNSFKSGLEKARQASIGFFTD